MKNSQNYEFICNDQYQEYMRKTNTSSDGTYLS